MYTNNTNHEITYVDSSGASHVLQPGESVNTTNTTADNSFINLVIPAGQSLTNTLLTNGLVICRLYMPLNWNTADLTIQVASTAVPTTWYNLWDYSGAEFTISAAAGLAITIPPALFLTDSLIRFRSGTSGTPVNQDGARTIKVFYRAF